MYTSLIKPHYGFSFMLNVYLPALDPPFLTLSDAATSAIHFTLKEGECLVVIGPNGSGKTSLLRMISQEISPRAGTITMDGHALASFSRRQRASMIAVLSQYDTPDLRLTVEDYVALGRLPYHRVVPHKENARIVASTLKDLGLDAFKQRSLGDLSGGEQQRAALARALAQTPRLLLLDEPTNHLDLAGRAAFLALVKRKNITTIAVLHDLSLVESFADRVLMLSQGQQVVWDTPEHTLTTTFLQPVFGLTSTVVAHPQTGKPLRFFDIPTTNV